MNSTKTVPAIQCESGKGWEKIVRLLGENGHMTTKTLSEALGISTQAVEKHLSNLKSEGKIIRIGPDKGGHWEVKDQ